MLEVWELVKLDFLFIGKVFLDFYVILEVGV